MLHLVTELYLKEILPVKLNDRDIYFAQNNTNDEEDIDYLS